MDRFIIYVRYDDYEYISRYYLIYNEQKVIEDEENKDEVFKKIIDMNKSDLYISIVQDKECLKWDDYNNDFNEKGFELYPNNEQQKVNIYETIYNILNIEKKQDLSLDEVKFDIIFSGNLVKKEEINNQEIQKSHEELSQDDKTKEFSDEIKNKESVNKQEISGQDVKSEDDKMTVLAKIIHEKYKGVK